jgi:hypothetical protein
MKISDKIQYGLIGATLLAGATLGVTSMWKDYRENNQTAQTAIEQQDYQTARGLLTRIDTEIMKDPFISISPDNEKALRDLLKSE